MMPGGSSSRQNISVAKNLLSPSANSELSRDTFSRIDGSAFCAPAMPSSATSPRLNLFLPPVSAGAPFEPLRSKMFFASFLVVASCGRRAPGVGGLSP